MDCLNFFHFASHCFTTSGIFPFFSDTQENIENLLLAIKDCGIRKTSLSAIWNYVLGL